MIYLSVYLNKKTKKYDCKGSYVDINGKQRFYTKRGFETSALAKKYDAEFLIKAKKTNMSRITCEDLVVEFLVYKEERCLKLRSISDYHNNYKKHFLPYFANHMIDKITIPDIEKWQENLLKKDYSAAFLMALTILIFLSVLNESPLFLYPRNVS